MSSGLLQPNPTSPQTAMHDDPPHQSLSQIKSLLADRGLRPRHRFGQNFLHDAAKMDAIVAAAELSEGDVVLEVGPGTGALSVRVLAAGARLVTVELDRELEPILREQFETFDRQGNRATLLIADVLAGKHAINPAVMEALATAARDAGTDRYKLIANLPYNVASPLLVNLLLASHEARGGATAVDNAPDLAPASDDAASPVLARGVVTIQREVADRLTASPGGKEYGPLGVMVQALCAVRRVATLPPGCFWPRPKVESAAVLLEPRDTPVCRDPHALADLLHRLFSKRRKQLGAIIGRNATLPAGISMDARPEQLTVEQLAELAEMQEREKGRGD